MNENKMGIMPVNKLLRTMAAPMVLSMLIRMIEEMVQEREFAKHDLQANQFYEWCQGKDWQTVVDKNTQALTKCATNHIPLFCKPLEILKSPILFMGSIEDEMCRKNLAEEYENMISLVDHGYMYIFKTGGHPAILSNAEMASKIIKEFLV